jgi:hypothetical protein
VAGGVIKGIANGLGPNGTSIVGMAAAAIANPSAALRTVENMAIKFATNVVTNVVNNYANQLGGYLTSQIGSGLGSALGSLNTSLAFGDAGSFLGGLTNTYNNTLYSLGLGSGTGFQDIAGTQVPFSTLEP